MWPQPVVRRLDRSMGPLPRQLRVTEGPLDERAAVVNILFMDFTKLNEFAVRYTAAWCSQNAASVALFFAEQGSLSINQGAHSVGRAAITGAAQGFMT
jgi:hypothetical protein